MDEDITDHSSRIALGYRLNVLVVRASQSALTCISEFQSILAVVFEAVSVITQKPLITHLTGISLIEGSILLVTGVIAIIGGLIALYYSYRGNGLHVIVGGTLGLIAPCALSALAIIGGYLMLREGTRGG